MLNDMIARYRRAGSSRRLFAQARLASDPLSDPALQKMSARELADIPWGTVGRR